MVLILHVLRWMPMVGSSGAPPAVHHTEPDANLRFAMYRILLRSVLTHRLRWFLQAKVELVRAQASELYQKHIAEAAWVSHTTCSKC
jgi:hypothetical protein